MIPDEVVMLNLKNNFFLLFHPKHELLCMLLKFEKSS